MRRILAVLVLVGSMVGSVAGASAKDGSPLSQFLEFPNLVIEGDLKAPAVTFENARDRVRFERLMRMDKRFLQPLDENGSAGLESVFK